jgi:hypothetical protein
MLKNHEIAFHSNIANESKEKIKNPYRILKEKICPIGCSY